MSQSKYGLRVLGMCVFAALGLMAFSGTVAHAETGANRMVGGANITGNKSIVGRLDGTANYPKLLSKLAVQLLESNA